MKTNDDEMDRELVTNCDRSFEVVANCDHIEKEENNISQPEIEKLILTIRGEQVIIDQPRCCPLIQRNDKAVESTSESQFSTVPT